MTDEIFSENGEEQTDGEEQTAKESPESPESPRRTHPRRTDALSAMMSQGWGETTKDWGFDPDAIALAGERRRDLAERFPDAALVIPSGPAKIRSNDVTYVFRPHTSFAQLTGLGARSDADAVLVVVGGAAVETVLFQREPMGPGTEAFYLDGGAGEYWTGRRPSMPELEAALGISVRPTSELVDFLRGLARPLRVVPDAAPAVEKLLSAEGLHGTSDPADDSDLDSDLDRALDSALATALDELRLTKTPWEIAQMQKAVDISIRGFEDVVESLPRAVEVARGERVVEAAFLGRARTEANDIGYGSTAAAGDNATTLHWDACDGPVRATDLVLLDAGAELETLYTADITRTVPASGTFTDAQRRIYQAVLDATDAAITAAVVGRPFQDPHDAAVTVLAQRLEEWGILPVTAAESLSDDGQHHRRWMPHATSHHLGLDVHDCAASRPENYRGAVIRPGMVFTVEPGLYFKADDLSVPEEFRGIGVRIEDDIVATDDGPINLSAALPRTIDDIEAWMAPLLERGSRVRAAARA
ncbi:aminopeptidase P family protein [Microbacterium sp. EST19A]|uniref:aminopeptidase P family protein n=1 Tax=Microbacterium sp. EST19A TaxID=2862681 RepID=UPI001CBB3078|nr:aminopeptidase P family protein [Microbacterium sp. EST19A]